LDNYISYIYLPLCSYTESRLDKKMLAIILLLVAAAAAEECNMACPMNYLPLCGVDGQTYSNDCMLRSMNCMRKTTVEVAYAGACVEVPVPVCNLACLRNYEPVCGTDGQTYGNACELQSTSCLKKSGVAVAYSGECQTVNLRQPKVCNEACLRNWEPVCGTDGITYGNMCQMESFACTKSLNLRVAHSGEC